MMLKNSVWRYYYSPPPLPLKKCAPMTFFIPFDPRAVTAISIRRHGWKTSCYQRPSYQRRHTVPLRFVRFKSVLRNIGEEINRRKRRSDESFKIRTRLPRTNALKAISGEKKNTYTGAAGERLWYFGRVIASPFASRYPPRPLAFLRTRRPRENVPLHLCVVFYTSVHGFINTHCYIYLFKLYDVHGVRDRVRIIFDSPIIPRRPSPTDLTRPRKNIRPAFRPDIMFRIARVPGRSVHVWRLSVTVILKAALVKSRPPSSGLSSRRTPPIDRSDNARN